MSHLDPRAPLVLDIHDLSRRPGTSRTVSRSVPAPADLGTGLLGVPADSEIELELLLEAVMEGVLVSGSARTEVIGACARCLTELRRDLEVELQELYAYPESDAAEDEAGRIRGDAIDLEPMLRDAVVLALPFRPLCTDDCAGLCPRCGVRLADDPDHRHDEENDPRWAALATLLHDGGSVAGSGGSTVTNKED